MTGGMFEYNRREYIGRDAGQEGFMTVGMYEYDRRDV